MKDDCSVRTQHKATPFERLLVRELNRMGLETNAQFFDGHKTIDIYIPAGKIYVEVDGQYHKSPAQKNTDYKRDSYSSLVGITTWRVTNDDVRANAKEVAKLLYCETLQFLRKEVCRILHEKERREALMARVREDYHALQERLAVQKQRLSG